MASYLEVFKEELKPFTCSQCDDTEGLQDLKGEAWCEGCLTDEEYEAEPTYLETCAERNMQ